MKVLPGHRPVFHRKQPSRNPAKYWLWIWGTRTRIWDLISWNYYSICTHHRPHQFSSFHLPTSVNYIRLNYCMVINYLRISSEIEARLSSRVRRLFCRGVIISINEEYQNKWQMQEISILSVVRTPILSSKNILDVIDRKNFPSWRSTTQLPVLESMENLNLLSYTSGPGFLVSWKYPTMNSNRIQQKNGKELSFLSWWTQLLIDIP